MVIEKDTTNGFQTLAFQLFIEQEAPFDRIMVIICCTDICILQFAFSLITYLRKMKSDTKVVVVKSAVETFESKDHPRQEFNAFSFKLMQNAGISVPERWEKQ